MRLLGFHHFLKWPIAAQDTVRRLKLRDEEKKKLLQLQPAGHSFYLTVLLPAADIVLSWATFQQDVWIHWVTGKETTQQKANRNVYLFISVGLNQPHRCRVQITLRTNNSGFIDHIWIFLRPIGFFSVFLEQTWPNDAAQVTASSSSVFNQVSLKTCLFPFSLSCSWKRTDPVWFVSKLMLLVWIYPVPITKY